jgi:hypothetical protein
VKNSTSRQIPANPWQPTTAGLGTVLSIWSPNYSAIMSQNRRSSPGTLSGVLAAGRRSRAKAPRPCCPLCAMLGKDDCGPLTNPRAKNQR